MPANESSKDGWEQVPDACESWLSSRVEGYRGPGRLYKFGFGQSNPTYRLRAASGDYVLRRKPFGPLLPRAHAIEREFQIMSALQHSEAPVPRMYALCEDSSVLGSPFFIMDFVEGRQFFDQTMPGLTAAKRSDIFDAMNAVVAKLHGVDPASVGLQSYGRLDNFLERQIALWTRQYRSTQGDKIAAMENLIAWLPENRPAEQPVGIFHGDLRIDNMIFHATEPRVIALLDWELSTLGDRIADFAYHVMVWRIVPGLFRGLAGLDWRALGIPSESEYVQRYSERTGYKAMTDWNFYLAFSFFRLAAILQGVLHRSKSGQASGSDAAEVGAKAAPLAEIGWQIARNA